MADNAEAARRCGQQRGNFAAERDALNGSGEQGRDQNLMLNCATGVTPVA